jgi:hypothetical protein
VDQDSTTTTQLRQRGVGSGFKVQLMDLKLFSAPVVAVELVFWAVPVVRLQVLALGAELALRSAPQERLELAPVEAEAQAPEDLAGVRVVPAVLVL